MALGLLDKLTNFLVEDEDAAVEDELSTGERRTKLRVHELSTFKVYVMNPSAFDDVRVCADYLKANVAVVFNFEGVDSQTQQRICDFIDGVCVVIGGASQRVSETVMLCVPPNVDINRELYTYSLPAFKRKKIL
ncbi:MAG: sepF 1 [Firmicutes bacterium]|nr:sepF 1 [Bacillota bacterium]